jgi:hypothetical protein
MTGGYGETFKVRIYRAKEIRVYVAIGREGFDKSVNGFGTTLRFMLREDFLVIYISYINKKRE